jgi:hypothetical protein
MSLQHPRVELEASGSCTNLVPAKLAGQYSNVNTRARGLSGIRVHYTFHSDAVGAPTHGAPCSHAAWQETPTTSKGADALKAG